MVAAAAIAVTANLLPRSLTTSPLCNILKTFSWFIGIIQRPQWSRNLSVPSGGKGHWAGGGVSGDQSGGGHPAGGAELAVLPVRRARRGGGQHRGPARRAAPRTRRDPVHPAAPGGDGACPAW